MDKKKKGYILLEMILSILVISLIILGLYQITTVSSAAKTKLEDKAELNQQFQEIDFQIRNLVMEANEIISVSTRTGTKIEKLSIGSTYSISSVKFKLRLGEESSIVIPKNKELSYKKNTKKLFINALTKNNNSEGGYEIGDYVEDISLRLNSENNIVFFIELKKNDTTLKSEISVLLNKI